MVRCAFSAVLLVFPSPNGAISSVLQRSIPYRFWNHGQLSPGNQSKVRFRRLCDSVCRLFWVCPTAAKKRYIRNVSQGLIRWQVERLL